MMYPERWIEECEVAARIRDNLGVETALDYLVQEKFLNFLNRSEQDTSWAAHIPGYVIVIKALFEPRALEKYLRKLKPKNARPKLRELLLDAQEKVND